MIDELQQRFDLLLNRLSTAYDGIGHSSGRPYLYFVYPLAQERHVQRMLGEQTRSHASLAFLCIDMLEITIASLEGQEERRQQFLNDPLRSQGQAEAILRVWARKLSEKIAAELGSLAPKQRPVVVLYNLAALHPLGDPTSLMEFLAEREPRNPQTGAIVPITLLVPGSRPPQSSRAYLFLEQIQLDFYRGEEI
jgi:hypothetical protein